MRSTRHICHGHMRTIAPYPQRQSPLETSSIPARETLPTVVPRTTSRSQRTRIGSSLCGKYVSSKPENSHKSLVPYTVFSYAIPNASPPRQRNENCVQPWCCIFVSLYQQYAEETQTIYNIHWLLSYLMLNFLKFTVSPWWLLLWRLCDNYNYLCYIINVLWVQYVDSPLTHLCITLYMTVHITLNTRSYVKIIQIIRCEKTNSF